MKKNGCDFIIFYLQSLMLDKDNLFIFDPSHFFIDSGQFCM